MMRMLGRGLDIIMPPPCASVMYLVPLSHEATPHYAPSLWEWRRHAGLHAGSLRVTARVFGAAGVKMASGVRGVYTDKPDTVVMHVAWDGDDGAEM
jgi:hypothetical protein